MTVATKFFPDLYHALYNDVATHPVFHTHTGAARHYTQSGINEGRIPNLFFFPDYYLGRYDDVRNVFGSYKGALDHWIRNGVSEARRGSPFFDPAFYLREHRDVSNSIGATNFAGAFDHWFNHGRFEGRRTIPESPESIFTDGSVTLIRASVAGGLFPTVHEVIDAISDIRRNEGEDTLIQSDWSILYDAITGIIRANNPDNEDGQDWEWGDPVPADDTILGDGADIERRTA